MLARLLVLSTVALALLAACGGGAAKGPVTVKFMSSDADLPGGVRGEVQQGEP